MIRALFVFLCILFIKPAGAQEHGLLAKVLNDSCTEYISSAREGYKTFCSGYVEALVEQKQHDEGKDIYACYPTYGGYDPFKKKVVKDFMYSYERRKRDGEEYVRAFNLVNEAIDKQLEKDCAKQ